MGSKIRKFFDAISGEPWRRWPAVADLPAERLIRTDGLFTFNYDTPHVDIRKSSETDDGVTIIHIMLGDATSPLTIRLADTGDVLSEWRRFIDRVRTNLHLIVVKDYYNWLLGDKMAESQVITDTRGYRIGPLLLYKKSLSEDFQIQISSHVWGGSIEQFSNWLDRVIDLHRPYLPTQPE
jgi:hypothetical protein